MKKHVVKETRRYNGKDKKKMKRRKRIHDAEKMNKKMEKSKIQKNTRQSKTKVKDGKR